MRYTAIHTVTEHREEPLETWLCRQLLEILGQHIQSDGWQGDGSWVGIRSQQHLANIILSPDDRQWLIDRYARHPEVLAVWAEACRAEKLAA